MKTKKLFLFLAFLTGLFSYAETDKYRLVLVSDPGTSITIAWNQISGSEGVVFYGIQDFGQNADAYPMQKTVDRSVNYRGMDNKFVRLTNLAPDTAYYFVIQDNEGVSERFWFKTAPNDQSKLSFVAGGDSRNNLTPRRNANLMVSKLKPHAVLFGGDMINQDNNGEWQQWLDDWQLTTASDGRMFPIVPTRGNHEAAASIYNLFDTPTQDSYYALTFGDNFFRVYTLNSEISVFGNQRDWLESDLQMHDNAYWKYVQYHRPMRPHTASKPEGIDRYNAWAELFYLHAVRLVLESDSHMVKTTYPVRPSSGPGSEEGFEIDMDRGTVYTGEGCWGAPLRPNDDDKHWTRASGSFNQFKWFFVDDEKIEMFTIKVDNAQNVEELTNANPFVMPNNIDIWTMPDGTDSVIIYPTQSFQVAEAKFSDQMPDSFEDRNSIEIIMEIIDEGPGIEEVQFFAKKNDLNASEITLAVLTAEPFEYTVALPEDGQYEIRALVTTTEGLQLDIYKNINVGTFTISSFISILSGNDDIEESEEEGNMYFTSSDLELGFDSHANQNYQRVGLRFEGVTIPNGAEILEAYIVFTPKDSHSTPAESTIFIENVSHAEAFSSANFDLFNREKVSTSVVWDIAPWVSNTVNESSTTPDLKELIQEVVGLQDWQSGNAMSFMFAPSGPSLTSTSNKRNAHAYEGTASGAPKLYFTYYYSVSGYENVSPQAEFSEEMSTDFSDRNNVEVLFDILEEGAGIESVQFYAELNQQNSTEIYLETITGGSYDFTTSLPEDGQYTIRAIVNAVNNHTIEVCKTINVGVFEIISHISITEGDNDIEEAEETGFMYFDSSSLELGYDNTFGGQHYQKLGLRFANLPIPQGAELNYVYLEFTPRESHYTSAETTIYLQDSYDAEEFTEEAFDLTDRVKLQETIVWEIGSWNANVVNLNTQSPDLKTLLQTVVNQENWEQNNAVVFMLAPSGPSLTHPSNVRKAFSYEGDVLAAPKLHFSFTYNTNDLSENEFNFNYVANVYPNPANNFFTIDLGNSIHTKVKVDLVDMRGRMVKAEELTLVSGKANVDIKDLKMGMYFVSVYVDNSKIVTKKVIKK